MSSVKPNQKRRVGRLDAAGLFVEGDNVPAHALGTLEGAPEQDRLGIDLRIAVRIEQIAKRLDVGIVLSFCNSATVVILPLITTFFGPSYSGPLLAPLRSGSSVSKAGAYSTSVEMSWIGGAFQARISTRRGTYSRSSRADQPGEATAPAELSLLRSAEASQSAPASAAIPPMATPGARISNPVS